MPIEEKTADVVIPETDISAEQNQQATGLPEDVQKRLEYLEKEFKETIKQRDELKKKIRETEDAKEKEKLEALQKAGKYEELNLSKTCLTSCPKQNGSLSQGLQ